MTHDPEVLLVEDDPDDVFLALRALGRAGIESVKVAGDGSEALALLDAAPGARPRVILLDLQLPGLSGLEVLQELRRSEATRRIPVVVVSTSTLDSDIEAAYRHGANSYVVKRVDRERPGGHFADAAVYWLRVNEIPGG